jgi:nitrite reductase/ring-hydroxylating ferredoxin subunit
MGTFRSGVLKCPQHNAVFDARTGEVRGQPVMAMQGIHKLPKELMEAMVKMGPIMARIESRPLNPLPVAVSNGSVRVLV